MEASVTDQNSPTADNFFDGVGQSGAPSFKFNGVNSGVRGTVVDQYATFVTEPGSREPKTYADGNPIPQLNVTLQTDLRNWDKVSKVPTDENGKAKPASEDDGLRRIYVKYDMRKAVGRALQQVSEKALKTGGELAVKQSGTDDRGKANPLPLYEARYKAPEAGADFFDGQADEAQASQADAGSSAASGDDEPPF